jgi:hypothetical protein
MKPVPVIVIAAAAALWPLEPANSANLTVVEVGAPAVNCVFDSNCKVVVDDSSGTLAYAPLGSGGFLQSRTYPGMPGTPGAGTTAYEYRIDLTAANPFADCLAGVVINFGPVKQLTYPKAQPGHVFVTTQGGLGSVGIQSAELDGDVITFTFSTYLCGGQTSYFFGLASAAAPQTATATLFGIGNPPFIQVDARTPTH